MRNANENAAKKTRRNLAIGASAVAAAFMFALSAGPVAAVAAEAPAGADIPDVVSVWRLYNEATGEHLYTTDDHEVQVLTSSYGWKSEGEGWKASTEGEPVWRLYQPTLNDHLYTDDEHEVQVLTTERGWRADFDGEPLFFSSGTVDVYRLYNSASGRHLITRDVNEYVTLSGEGWTQEGVKLHGVGLDDTWVPEVGHWEQKQTGQNWVEFQWHRYTLYSCGGCDFQTRSEDEMGEHQSQAVEEVLECQQGHWDANVGAYVGKHSQPCTKCHSPRVNYWMLPMSEPVGAEVPDSLWRDYQLYICNGCGWRVDDREDDALAKIDAHFSEARKDKSHPSNYTYATTHIHDVIGGGYYEPVYENVWVVDSPGHWE